MPLDSEKASYEYPYSEKWLFFSCLLVALSVIFTLYVLLDNPISILLFFAYTSILAVIFFLLKLRVYSRNQPYSDVGAGLEEKSPKRFFFIMLLVILIGLFTPFLLLLILEPVNWFLSITGFIAGINIPEILLYVQSKRSRRHLK